MKLKEHVRNPYNYDVNEESDRTGLLCLDESLTAQEFLEESDINYIADKFMRTGELKEVINMPTSGDFEGIFDFQTAMNTIAIAKQEFMKLPAKIRTRFDNDPAKLVDFLDNMKDDDDRAEAIRLGLIKKPEVPKDEQRTPSVPERTTEATTRTARTETDTRKGTPDEKPGPKDR